MKQPAPVVVDKCAKSREVIALAYAVGVE